MLLALSKGESHDDRTIFTVNCRLFCAGYASAGLLPQSLLVFVYRVRGHQLDPVCLYELVSDDDFSEKARSQTRRSSVESSLNKQVRNPRCQNRLIVSGGSYAKSKNQDGGVEYLCRVDESQSTCVWAVTSR